MNLSPRRLVGLATAACAALLLLACGGGDSSSGSTANPVEAASTNPVPRVSSLQPASAAAGSPAFTLTVNGSQFVRTSTITWNGVALTTTYVSSQKLRASVPAADIATAGNAVVAVTNPAPGGGTSNAATFNIQAVNPVPAVSGLSPGSVASGSASFALAVTGSNFVATSTVKWNGTALATTYVSATQLGATVPAADVATGGTAKVTVTNPTPGGGTSNAATFDIIATNPTPALSSIAPANTTAGAANFTLTATGTNFVAASTINWNGTALATTYVSSTQLTATVPAADVASAGTAQVNVTSPAPGGGASSADTFTINATNPTPTLSTVAPASATATGPAFTLIVSGSGFVSASTIDWNGAALATTYVSSTQLTAVVPAADIASSGTANVTVASPAPGGGTSSPVSFTINPANPAPTLSGVAPTSISSGSQAFTLTVNGSGFISTSTVDWNGTALPTAFVSTTQLTAQVPASDVANAGTYNVTVVTPSPGGGTSASTPFTVIATNPAPTLASMSPSTLVAGGPAFTLTVNGSGFVASSSIAWNGNALPTTYVSATQLTAPIAASAIAAVTTASITVSSPAPGGGTSSALTLNVVAGPYLAQYNVSQTSGTNGVNSLAVPFSAPTHAGSTIWVAVTISDYAGVHTLSVTDSQGNVYTLLDQENDGNPGYQSVAHFVATNIAGDSTTPNVVTVSHTWENYDGVLVAEIAGTSGAAALVGHSANIQDGLAAGTNNVTSGAIAVTAAQTPALLVALSMNTSGGSSDLGGTGFGGPAAGNGLAQVAQMWNWGINLATLATEPVTSAASVAATFNAPDKDSYVTVGVVFH
ncbi:MAG TPA: IPT/TIG domain-containing protein [Burkholderiaceae bacterium]|nr:IPT/TIG domain-containing protein [Burkholderiaceae bacterium]